MAEAFMGRLESYVTAIDANDKNAFCAALLRNLFRGSKAVDPLANGLVDYLLTLSMEIEALPAQVLLSGQIAASK
jgi:hypothetical protein